MDESADRSRQSTLARWSLGLGICSIFVPFLLSLLAIILGHMGSRRARKQGQKPRRAGLVIGYSTLAMWVGSLFIPVYGMVTPKSLAIKSLAHGRQIYLVLRNYAEDHNGQLPESLDDLIDRNFRAESLALLQSHPHVDGDTFNYVARENLNDLPPKTPILVSQPVWKGTKKIVIYADGSSEMLEIDEP
ncbi:MAG: DUF4190 domain-containing protein [Verrucomicrobiales bacterium]